jgi:hypothetical protein
LYHRADAVAGGVGAVLASTSTNRRADIPP